MIAILNLTDKPFLYFYHLTVTNQKPYSQSWVFSQTEDLWIFIGPLVLSYLILAIMHFSGMGIYKDGPSYFYYLIALFVDGSHGITTFVRLSQKQDISKPQKTFFFFLPILIWLVIWSLIEINLPYIEILISYFAIYHFIKQQYGWMRITSVKTQSLTAKEELLDKIMIYNVTLFPILYWSFIKTNFGWYGPEDIIKFYDYPWMKSFLIIVHTLILVIYTYSQIKANKLRNQIPWGKYQIILVTWIAWVIPIVILESHIAKVLCFAIPHGLQYYYINFKVSPQEHNKTLTKSPRSQIAHLLRFYVTFVLIEFFIMLTDKKIIEHLSSYFIAYQKPEAGFLAFVSIFQIWHFIADGYIWKIKSKNSIQLQQALNIY